MPPDRTILQGLRDISREQKYAAARYGDLPAVGTESKGTESPHGVDMASRELVDGRVELVRRRTAVARWDVLFGDQCGQHRV